MSTLDAEGGLHHGGGRAEYKNFIQTSRDRLLHEMLQSTNTPSSKAWKVLIMDKVTVRVMSSSCKMSDITDQGISLVEELFKRREPMPSMDAIYYMQPTKENMVMFLSDMSGREPLYRKAFIFFSGPVPKELVNHIKSDTSVVSRIGALREMNMEYFPIESQVFVTDNDMALDELYGASSKDSRKFDSCLNTMAMRIATVFASLKELPHVRYRAAKESDTMSARELVPTKLASAIWECLEKYKSTIQNYPQTETCDLLIIDRSVDQIAPVIHEWTYDAMCHDLLQMDGKKYVIEVPSKSGGPPEKKELVLDDTDPVWLEIRNLHIAEASERLSDKFTTFQSKNKAAQLGQAARDGGELSTRDLQKMVQDLPQYTEMMEKLSAHVEIAGKINNLIGELGLRDLGQLEQDLVFGDAAAKDVITYFRTNQDTSPENKLRLLMIYACVHPDKFDADKASKLMQLAKSSEEDMKAIKNMMLLAQSSHNKKKTSGGFSLKFDAQKRKVAARKDRDTGEEESWALSRFYPMLEELIENIDKGSLGKEEFQCINEGGSSKEHKRSASSNPGTTTTTTTATATGSNPTSRRSRRTANWGRSQHSDDGASSDSVLKNATNDLRKMGKRIFIFMIGGATRSEIRVCHKLTTKLRREVVMGTTSVDDPPQYITVQSINCFAAGEDFLTNDIRMKPELDALGALGDLGWYCIGASLWAANYDLPKSVKALQGTVTNEAGVILSCGASLHWEDGRTGTFHCSFLEYSTMDITAVGTKGTLHVNDFVIPWEENEVSFSTVSGTSLKDLATKWRWTHKPSEHRCETHLPQEALMVKEFCALVKKVEQNGEKPEMKWASLSRKTQAVVDAVKASIEKGCQPVEVVFGCSNSENK